jgi:hypothetical protein
MSDERRRGSRIRFDGRLLARVAALTLAAFAVSSGVAAAHGGEDLAEQPARALVQQALGLLTQQDDAAEAAERLEAATASANTKDVDIDAAEKALKALEAGDTEAAIARMNEALVDPEKRDPSGPPAGEEPATAPSPDEDPDADEHGAGEAAEGSLENQTEAVEPDRSTEGWAGFAIGVGLIGAGAGLLLRRRTPA